MKIDEVLRDPNDPYRQVPLRLLGYVGNVADVLLPVIGQTGTNLAYLTSLAYFLADGYDKTKNASPSNIVFKGCDVLIWQLLASVAIPRITRYRVTMLTKDFLLRSKMSEDLQTRIAMATGLLSLGIIINPVDRFVDFLMDNTYRKIVNS